MTEPTEHNGHSSTRENLHFVVVGHVDHGKSTLIGRLLYDTNSLPPDKMEEVRNMSRRDQEQPEFAFVMDHLEEERRQRITIDTAQIFFSTDQRDYVIIDAPGHKQFLKNMITGATQAEAALLLVDAQEGLKEQTHRHAYMLSLLGLKQLIVVINKMDLVDYQQERFETVKNQITSRLADFSLEPLMVVPISAQMGDNIAQPSESLAWFKGPTLLDALNQLTCTPSEDQGPLRFPIQDVYDIDGDRILVGRVASGTIHAGQQLTFHPADQSAKIACIKVLDAQPDSAAAGESIGLILEPNAPEPIYHRGQIATAAADSTRTTAATSDSIETDDPASLLTTNQVTATVFWMSPEPLQLNEQLILKCATQHIPGKVTGIAQRLDSSSLNLLADQASELAETEVAQLTIKMERPVCLDRFEAIPETGQFVLMRGSDTVAGGVVH